MTRAARSRNTYIVLGIIIVGLSLYVAFRQRDRMQYSIPSLEPLNAREIKALEIEQAGEMIKLVRAGETWQIQPEGYRADPVAIREMLKTVTELKLTELVSVTGNYGRYDLEEKSRIRVTAYKNDEVLRLFHVGKRSPNYNHTFIRMEGDDRVFQSPGNLGAVFGLSVEGLRDRLVLSFDPEAITEIRAQGGGWAVKLIRTPEDSSQYQSSTGPTNRAAWSTKSGKAWDAETIEKLLNTLSDLKAFRYREQGDRDGEPVFTILLMGEKPYSLEVFARVDNLYPARSSESEYPFALFYPVTENIMSVFTGGRP